MAVPEAAFDLDDRAVLRKDDVGPSRELHNVQAVAVAHPVESAADRELGLSVFPSDAGHNFGPLGAAERVGHG
jgi:hypothetical protein